MTDEAGLRLRPRRDCEFRKILSVRNLFSSSDRAECGPATSTADYYHLDGLYWLRPYDLRESFGVIGAKISCEVGYRYAWIFSPDHADETHGWGEDAGSIYVGFSNDPAILPDPATLRKIIPFRATFPQGAQYFCFQVPWLVHNPESQEYPFHLYLEGHSDTGTHQPREEEVLFRSKDLFAWIPYGVTHCAAGDVGLTAYQTVTRLEANHWISVGAADPINGRLGTKGIWSSKDGLEFKLERTIRQSSGQVKYDRQAAPDIEFRGQRYAICIESEGDRQRCVSCVPIDFEGNLGPNAGRSPIQISRPYLGKYPHQDHLHSISGYAEDGVCHLWAVHGFFSDVRLIYGATHSDGGGLDEQFIDYYAFIFDEDAAATAAPSGLSGDCASGTVRLCWHELTERTYRVYRGDSSEEQSQLIAEVNGSAFSDQPGLDRRWWYRVVSLRNGVEQKSRVISVHASMHCNVTNHHINRAIQSGAAPQSIDAQSIDVVVAWLNEHGLFNNLLFWTNPLFGRKHDGCATEKLFDLGTTRLPRGGDCATQEDKANDDRLAIFHPSESLVFAYGAGRTNLIRRKSRLSFVVAYESSGAGPRTLLHYGCSPDLYLIDEVDRATFRISYHDANKQSRSQRLVGLCRRAIRNPTRYINAALNMIITPQASHFADLSRTTRSVRERLAPHVSQSRNYDICASAPLGSGAAFNVIAGMVDTNVVTTYANGLTKSVQGHDKMASDISLDRAGAVLQVDAAALALSCQPGRRRSHTASIIVFGTKLSDAQLSSLSDLLRRQLKVSGKS